MRARFPRVATLIVSAAMIAAGVTAATGTGEVVVASGKLKGQIFGDTLFHIDDFWMQVPSETLFNQWLSQGLKRKVIIRLMADPARYADAKNVRVLTGLLQHQTAPKSGRLPAGDSAFVHVLFLKDDRTGTLGAVTFQTADLATAAKFDAFDDGPVSIVIQIK